MSWISQFIDPKDMACAETLPKRKRAYGRILTIDAVVPGTIAHESRIPRDRLKLVNTRHVLHGERMAQYRAAQNAHDFEMEKQRKMQNQMHERHLRRQFLQERADHRKSVQLQSGQSEISMQASGERSNSFMKSTLHSNSSGSCKKPVPPGDILTSIERFSRLPGRESDNAGGLVPNGSMSYDGGEKSLDPTFVVDDTQREARRVVTGGPQDRLNYSDGSFKVLLDPKVVLADPQRASKPLILRNGSCSTIGSLAMRGLAGAPGHLEVPQLTGYHMKSESTSVPARGDDLSYTTSKSPRSWERSVRVRERTVDKSRDVLARPDLDAVAEYYALRKVQKEQEERRQLHERLAQHRDGMLKKMEERQARRLCLQVKAGQVHPQALIESVGGEFFFGSEEEVAQGLAPSLEEVLSNRWTGSWTAHSQYAGSLTHNATRGHMHMLHAAHRYRMDH